MNNAEDLKFKEVTQGLWEYIAEEMQGIEKRFSTPGEGSNVGLIGITKPARFTKAAMDYRHETHN